MIFLNILKIHNCIELIFYKISFTTENLKNVDLQKKKYIYILFTTIKFISFAFMHKIICMKNIVSYLNYCLFFFINILCIEDLILYIIITDTL